MCFHIFSEYYFGKNKTSNSFLLISSARFLDAEVHFMIKLQSLFYGGKLYMLGLVVFVLRRVCVHVMEKVD